MSWQLLSTTLVLVALGAGFGWYERSRPSSKLVALVATLAALAVAGRVVFAAIPNVQATTDVVLLSGYALGAGPGFVVGSVGALASNFFLGQGPWTPWQMLGWGAVGVAGAALGRLAGRAAAGSPARVPLALACALAGLAFGAWMDLFTLVTFAAERSLHTYLAISATSLPFNIAHAVGNTLLCLLFGPGFLRLLLRFRARFDFEWKPLASNASLARAGTTVMPALALVALLLPTFSDRARAAGVRDAVRYLEGAQNPDGGFGGAPGQQSSQLMTGWAVLGLEAAGRHPFEVRRGKRSAIGFLREHSGELRETGDVERTMIAVSGAGLSTRSFAGHSLVKRLLLSRRADGSFDGQVNLTAFGILALRAAGRPPRSRLIDSAARWLVREQSPDGGFSYSTRRGASDVDDTGAALQALAAARRERAVAVARALSYLRRAQNADGGFGQLSRSRSNAQSTAWAIQGLVAVGRNPLRFTVRGSRSPVAYLDSLQQGDGSFRYSRTSAQTPVWVTAQATMALRREPFPLSPARRRSTRSRRSRQATDAGRATGQIEVPRRSPSSRHRRGQALGWRPRVDAENATLASRAGAEAPPAAKSHGALSLAAWSAVAAGAGGVLAGLWVTRRMGQKRAKPRL